jgi:hypothetical protein
MGRPALGLRVEPPRGGAARSEPAGKAATGRLLQESVEEKIRTQQ